MLNKAQLLEQINATMGKARILELALLLQNKNFELPDLIALTFHENKNIAFRAAWLLENVFLQQPEAYFNHLDYLIRSFGLVKHASCKRHYAKIAMYITSPKAGHNLTIALTDIDMEPVVNQCFEWIIDLKVKVAVKTFAAEVLFNLRHRYPWIAEELPLQLALLMQNGSPGIQVKGARLLGYLQPLS